jgi:hypothetical protein
VRVEDDREAAHYVYTQPCVGGRRPAGWQAERAARGRSPVGGWFALQARLEAASVRAFLDLERDLEAHGAAPLARAARRAAADEVLHAAMCAGLARRHGARVEPRATSGAAPGSLLELALENAVEGCVREAYGAVIATWQAQAAVDPLVRAVMARIAADETRHAALSRAIDAWALPRLDDEGRAVVAAARLAAVRELEIGEAVGPELVAAAGLPDLATARALHAGLCATLWEVA